MAETETTSIFDIEPDELEKRASMPGGGGLSRLAALFPMTG